MGKKTKKEKILAEYHRKLAAISTTYSYKTPDKIVAPILSSEPHDDYSYVSTDLRRIAILTALAICAQLVLWYKLGH